MSAQPDSGSPFAPLIADSASGTATAFRTQFLIGAHSDAATIVSGRLDCVWHRPPILWPAFWLLGQLGVLFHETGSDVPAMLRISGGTYKGQPCQFWERRFQFARESRLDAVVIYDARRQHLIELLGPRRTLEIEWRTRFDDQSLRITVRSWAVRLGPVRLPIPSLLIGTLRIRQTALTDDTVRLRFVHTHPIFGEVFGYEGTLSVQREAKA